MSGNPIEQRALFFVRRQIPDQLTFDDLRPEFFQMGLHVLQCAFPPQGKRSVFHMARY